MTPMPRRFQFSLARLLGAASLISVASASTSVLLRDYGFEADPIVLALIFASTGAAIGLLLSKQWGPGAAFGAVLGLIIFGLFAFTTVRALE
jgi:hypothetical protein